MLPAMCYYDAFVASHTATFRYFIGLLLQRRFSRKGTKKAKGATVIMLMHEASNEKKILLHSRCCVFDQQQRMKDVGERNINIG